MIEKLKKLYNKANFQELPLIVATSCIDDGSTWIGVRAYGPEGENQPIARALMQKLSANFGKLGLDLGILMHDLLVYTPLIYSIPLGLKGIETKIGKKIKNPNSYVKKIIEKNFFSNTALVASILTRYSAGLQNVYNLAKSLNLPEPLNAIVPIAAATSIGAPYFYSVARHFSKKFTKDPKKDEEEGMNSEDKEVIQ